MNESATIDVEQVATTAEPDSKLVVYAKQTGLEKASTETLVEAFRPIFAKARTAINSARGVAESVKDATCVTEIRKSRACRLALRAVRLESDATRKKHKEHALLYGRAVDGFHNILLADLAPVESSLQEAEDIAERAEAARKAALKIARENELRPLMDTPILGDISELTEEAYAKMLGDAKLLRQAKIDAAAKAEADRKAKEEAERADRERIAAENAKLKAEAEEAKRLAEIERKRIEAERDQERQAAELERKRIEAERAEEKRKAEAEAARLAAIAKKEREAIEAKARDEAEKAAKEAARLKAELAAKEEAEAEQERQRVEEAKQAALATKRAAAAPDKAKLKAFAATVRALAAPPFGDAMLSVAVSDQIESWAKWVEAQIARMP